LDIGKTISNDETILNLEDMDRITRLKPKVPRDTSNKRPAPILVVFKTKLKRNQFMDEKKQKRRMMFPYHMENRFVASDGEQQVYFNPMLTRENKDLLYYARQQLKPRENPKFKFVWYKDGKVLARKTPEAKVIWCKDKSVVDELFKDK
jgi:Baculovirus FP protein